MITQAIDRALKKAKDKGWDKIYWAIDVHNTCLLNTHASGEHHWLSDGVVDALRYMSDDSRNVITLWSSAWPAYQEEIVEFFKEEGIRVSYFNENPEISSSGLTCFDKKFYFDILIDDKAGFEWETDWDLIVKHLKEGNENFH